jgi:tetratricopeptide (TPR) repeat protein
MWIRLVLAGLASIVLLSGQGTMPRSLADADQLEAQIEANPGDLNARLMLIRYYWDAAGVPAERVKAALRKHGEWLVEQRAGDLPLFENWATLSRDAEAASAADRAWRKHLAAPSPAALIYANAIRFYRLSDPAFARKIADDGMQAFPRDIRLGMAVGAFDAVLIVGMKGEDKYGMATSFDDAIADSPDAKRARKELETSENPSVPGGAAGMLQNQLSQLERQKGAQAGAEAQSLAERCFERAIRMEPANPAWTSGLSRLYQSRAARSTSPAEKVAWYEKAVSAVTGTGRGLGVNEFSLMADLAKARCDAGDYTKAAADAREALRLASDFPTNWAYGNAIHYGNIVLGRVAMHEGDNAEAARRLLIAGGMKGSPQLNSFGPDWKLAGELMAHGDTATVLSYIDLCRKFWTSGAKRLDSWAMAIRAGGAPNFSAGPEIVKPDLVGRPAPAIRLPRLKGGEVSLEDFKGKVVLVDFWATWCAPCRAEMPGFERLHKELGSKDVVILAVDVGEPEDLVAEYINKEKFTFPVLLANETDVASRYGVNAYPTLAAIDPQGKVADYLIGGRSESALRDVIAKARAGAPPPGPAPAAAVLGGIISAIPTNAISPVTAEDFYRDGIRRRGANDLTGALKAFERALDLRKDWLAAMVQRANCLYALKRYDDVIAVQGRAIELDPRRAAFYNQRGLAYSNSTRHAQAIPDYTRAIEIDPRPSGVYNNRGWAYLELGKLDESLADLQKSLEIDPANTTALGNLSRVHMARKQYAEAVADCEAALMVNPALAWATDRKAEARRLLGGPASSSLAAPRLLSPAAEAVFEHYPRQTTLVWGEVAGASAYVVQWDYQDDGGWAADGQRRPVATTRVTEPVVVITFVGAQRGRWRVQAVDAAGKVGATSEWREFRYTR